MSANSPPASPPANRWELKKQPAKASEKCPTCPNGQCPQIDATPAYPEPPGMLIEKAMAALPDLLTKKVDPNSHGGRLEVCAGHLAAWVGNLGHGKPAAEWAIYRFLQNGMLTAHLLPASIPNFFNPKTKEWLFPTTGTFRSLPNGRPAPYSDFMVRATAELWVWWKEVSASTSPPAPGTSAATPLKRGRKAKDVTKQRADFAHKLVHKGMGWPEIYDAYRAKYPEDQCNDDMIRQAYNRNYGT